VNDACGTSFSEWITCEGYIDFGTITLDQQPLALQMPMEKWVDDQEGK